MAQRICSIQGCDEAHHARGWCRWHYLCWKAHGDPLAGTTGSGRATPADRFWPKVDMAGPTPKHAPELGRCWIWRAGTTKQGYGRFSVEGQTMTAHRWAYIEAYGPPPPGFDVHHRCRNPSCVRASHLEALTPEEHGTLNGWSRKTHCPRGHPYSSENTYMRRGTRTCRICNRQKCREYYQRRKARERSGRHA